MIPQPAGAYVLYSTSTSTSRGPTVSTSQLVHMSYQLTVNTGSVVPAASLGLEYVLKHGVKHRRQQV